MSEETTNTSEGTILGAEESSTNEEVTAESTTVEDQSTEERLYPDQAKGEEEVSKEETSEEQGEVKEDDKEVTNEVPDKYEFTAPEGVELDKELMSEAEPMFKELGLNNEQAQKIVDLQVKHFQKLNAESEKAFEKTMSDWVSEVKADSEIGGDNFDKSVKLANSAISKLDTSGKFVEMLRNTGLGNHPEMVRVLSKVGQSMQEDQPVRGAASGPKQTAVERMYGSDS